MADTTTTAPAGTPEVDDLFSPPAERVRTDYFGEIVTVDIWDCVLRKGAGKVLFDPRQHDIAEKRVAVKLSVECKSKDGSTYTIDQDEINTSSKWRTTLEGLKALGITTRQQLEGLKGQWAHIQRAATGQKYTAKSGQRAGTLVDEQALVFLALYPNQAASDAAETAFWDAQRAGRPATDFVAPQENLPSDLGADTAKVTALKALSMLWRASGHDQAVFKTMLESNPNVNQYYPWTHPQTIALINGAIDEDDPTAPF